MEALENIFHTMMGPETCLRASARGPRTGSHGHRLVGPTPQSPRRAPSDAPAPPRLLPPAVALPSRAARETSPAPPPPAQNSSLCPRNASARIHGRAGGWGGGGGDEPGRVPRGGDQHAGAAPLLRALLQDLWRRRGALRLWAPRVRRQGQRPRLLAPGTALLPRRWIPRFS